jgi:hypothetical protein
VRRLASVRLRMMMLASVLANAPKNSSSAASR